MNCGKSQSEERGLKCVYGCIDTLVEQCEEVGMHLSCHNERENSLCSCQDELPRVG